MSTASTEQSKVNVSDRNHATRNGAPDSHLETFDAKLNKTAPQSAAICFNSASIQMPERWRRCEHFCHVFVPSTLSVPGREGGILVTDLHLRMA
jgi:hypothetical protein